MQVEGAESGHRPDDLRQHPEGNYDSQVGPKLLHRTDESRIAQLLRLQNRQSEFSGRDLYVAFMQFLSASRRFVRSSDDPDDVVAAAHQCTQRRHGEFGRTHEDDSQILGVHFR